MKKILIIGAKGMLGQVLVREFSDYLVAAWDIEEINITNHSQVIEKISWLKPAVIINAAAYTEVDDCETNRDICMSVNGEALEYLAEAANKIKARLVHYSTDYIFDGTKSDGYPENFAKFDPVNFYGKSKLVGEQKAAKAVKHYIIRTQWLYGHGGKNFVDTMLRLGKEKDKLKIVNDQHGSPTWVKDLAQASRKLCESGKPEGVYHLVNDGETTWYEFALKIFELSGIDVKVDPVPSSEFPTPAKRPEYSRLLNTKFATLRTWQEALQEYLTPK